MIPHTVPASTTSTEARACGHATAFSDQPVDEDLTHDIDPIDCSLEEVVSDLFYRVEMGLLQYAAQADFWLSDEPTIDRRAVETAARWQRNSLKPLKNLLTRRRWPAPGREFPASYARFDAAARNHLLAEIVDNLEKTIQSIATARQIALAKQDSEALIALNRLQVEHRLLLSDLHDRLRDSETYSTELMRSGTQTGRQSIRRSDRSPLVSKGD